MKTSVVRLAGIDVEVFEAGGGNALLWLHGANGFAPAHPFVKPFAARRRLIAPSHPGFGKSGLPLWLDRPDDIAVVYLELLDKLGLARAELVGCSLGGWIAAEMASMAPERFARIVLVGPGGVKEGPGDKLDIPDIWAMPQEDVNKLLFHDPAKMQMDTTKLSDE